ncbi:lipopolysaccharide biosynthesis protein [Aureibacillus halotolerans]|uniref:O-antigen/teichoic acid export membrane protein n=1 Tax=Aureibacillus halotolerans TaxID=1508390 RepID=A0A4R6TXX8_9BACI|nr:polysaccharide biosynthesis C-terminal domain-containing protein [Aureibacillus halotolerans]TDQ37652.1 O-antigen/teichoic acid export membrane protein [Aureibacillus halotolerans]
MVNKIQKLMKNSLVFSVGNLGTKLILFFLIPVYTYHLTPSEFGTADLITVTSNLVLPLVTLSVFNGVFRFVMDKQYDKEAVLINSIVIMIAGSILLVMLYPLLNRVLPFGEFTDYFYIIVILQALNTIFMQYIRGCHFVKLYALSGMISSFILFLSNIIFLVVLDLGIDGYLLAYVITLLFGCVFNFFAGNIHRHINFHKIKHKLMKDLLIYSVPLMPNALMWWVMNFSDRYIIAMILGASANGLYAVASKIPSLLNTVHAIFFQAWQMSAIEEFDSEEKDDFFSKIFDYLSTVLMLCTSFIIVHLHFIISILVSSEYIESWKYTPFLLLASLFSAFSAFLGTNYIASKQTNGVFKSSFIGALVNIIITLLLVPIFGVNGAAFATMISFLFIFLLRVIDTKKYVTIHFHVKKLFLMFFVLLLQIAILFTDLQFKYYLLMFLFVVLLFINYAQLKSMLNDIMSMLRNRSGRKRR